MDISSLQINLYRLIDLETKIVALQARLPYRQNSRYPPTARSASALGPVRRKVAVDGAQGFPRRSRQPWIRADDFFNHRPGSQIEGAFRSRAHRQRNRALRAKTDSACGRFLPRSYPNGLREDVDRHRLVSGFELPIAAQAR